MNPNDWRRLTPGEGPCPTIALIREFDECGHQGLELTAGIEAEDGQLEAGEYVFRLYEDTGEPLALVLEVPEVKELMAAILARYHRDIKTCVCRPQKGEVCRGHARLVRALEPFGGVR